MLALWTLKCSLQYKPGCRAINLGTLELNRLPRKGVIPSGTFNLSPSSQWQRRGL